MGKEETITTTLKKHQILLRGKLPRQENKQTNLQLSPLKSCNRKNLKKNKSLLSGENHLSWLLNPQMIVFDPYLIKLWLFFLTVLTINHFLISPRNSAFANFIFLCVCLGTILPSLSIYLWINLTFDPIEPFGFT